MLRPRLIRHIATTYYYLLFMQVKSCCYICNRAAYLLKYYNDKEVAAAAPIVSFCGVVAALSSPRPPPAHAALELRPFSSPPVLSDTRSGCFSGWGAGALSCPVRRQSSSSRSPPGLFPARRCRSPCPPLSYPVPRPRPLMSPARTLLRLSHQRTALLLIVEDWHSVSESIRELIKSKRGTSTYRGKCRRLRRAEIAALPTP